MPNDYLGSEELLPSTFCRLAGYVTLEPQPLRSYESAQCHVVVYELDTIFPVYAHTLTTLQLDPKYIAVELLRVPQVEAVYTSGSKSDFHVWVVLNAYDPDALDAVFDRELLLREALGKRLASVEFHILPEDKLGQHSGWTEVGRR